MLTEDEVQILVDNTQLRRYAKGHLFQREGDAMAFSYLLLRGCVREYRLVDAEEKTTAIYTEGEVLNSFVDMENPAPSAHYLECVEECTLALCGKDLESHLISLIPRLETLMRKEMEKINLASHAAFSRYISTTPKERYQYLQEHRPDLLQRVPQHQIASYIGVSAETLSRIRKRMARENSSISK